MTKKSSDRMRTSSDVIKRLQWDENLPEEFFTIGYVDRFVGIVEDPFTKFSHWGDLVITVMSMPKNARLFRYVKIIFIFKFVQTN